MHNAFINMFIKFFKTYSTKIWICKKKKKNQYYIIQGINSNFQIYMHQANIECSIDSFKFILVNVSDISASNSFYIIR